MKKYIAPLILLTTIIILVSCQRIIDNPIITIDPTTPSQAISPVFTPTVPLATLTPKPPAIFTQSISTPTPSPTHQLLTATPFPQQNIPSPTATLALFWAACPNTYLSQLHVGMQVLISHTPDLPNRIRIEPNLDASTIAKIYPGETAEIIEGPACANGLTWWKIKTEQTDTTGWTVEGDAKSYWLIPCTDASACKTALLPSNLQDGLVLYLPFENTLNDFSDQGNDVTGHGAIAYTTGVLGQAAYFDGQDDWVEVSQGMNVGNQFTFSMVLRTPNLEAFLLQKGETCPDGKPDYLGTAYLVYLGKSYQGNYQSTGENGHLNVFLVAESGGPNDERIVSTSTQLLIPSTFQHILIVYQYPVITYYVNGKQIDRRIVYEKGGAGRSVPIAPQDFLGIHQTSSSLKIGVNESYCNRIHDFFSHFNGILDELRIYDRALGLEEIQELFQSYNITP